MVAQNFILCCYGISLVPNQFQPILTANTQYKMKLLELKHLLKEMQMWKQHQHDTLAQTNF